jgi:hypothetical protein
MHPRLTDPVLQRAVDKLPYRARRILFEWTAWALGGGNAERAMNVYAFQNLACWLMLAALLLRWFPPSSWGNCFRWAAVLFSFGLIFSVVRALLDGPSLLLVAAAMALIESGRPWAGALVMGIGGLGKETGVLCASALGPPDSARPGAWASWIGKLALAVLPLAAWMLCLRALLGNGGDVGLHNFAGAFAGLRNKLVDTASSLMAEGGGFPSETKLDALVLAGLLAQFFFFAFRQRWREPWWRLGATYAVLMAFLGGAVWENYPSAAARVLLPMTLAFNIIVPRRGWWPLLLIIGNLGVLASADIFKPPGRESYVVEGANSLRINPKDGSVIEAIYGPRNWWRPEKSRWEFWRWSMGDATIAIRNPQPFTLLAHLRFRLRSVDERGAIVKLGEKVLWSGMLPPGEVVRARIDAIELAPGDTMLSFSSDRPAAYPGNNDQRRLSFSVRSFEIDIERRK